MLLAEDVEQQFARKWHRTITHAERIVWTGPNETMEKRTELWLAESAGHGLIAPWVSNGPESDYSRYQI